VIYVADTGVMQAHDEFIRDGGPNVIAGIDAGGPAACAGAVLSPCFLMSSPGSILLFGHGTGVASIAAGRTTGVAPNASVVSVLAVGDAAVWLNAFHKIIEHAFDPSTPPFRTAIINISGGLGEQPIPSQLDALLARMTTGVNREGEADPDGKRFLIVAAAGNLDVDPKVTQCGPDRSVINYPARIAANTDGVISVGGIDRENRLWAGSCIGPLVEVAAPAADMLVASIFATDTYRFKPDFYVSGTSWAAPYVSGMAARLLEVHPDLSPAELERILRASPSRIEGIPVPVLVEEALVHGPRRRAARH
jgi:subtilisin family serine protease